MLDIFSVKEEWLCGYEAFSSAGSAMEHCHSDVVTRRRVELLIAAWEAAVLTTWPTGRRQNELHFVTSALADIHYIPFILPLQNQTHWRWALILGYGGFMRIFYERLECGFDDLFLSSHFILDLLGLHYLQPFISSSCNSNSVIPWEGVPPLTGGTPSGTRTLDTLIKSQVL